MIARDTVRSSTIPTQPSQTRDRVYSHGSIPGKKYGSHADQRASRELQNLQRSRSQKEQDQYGVSGILDGTQSGGHTSKPTRNERQAKLRQGLPPRVPVYRISEDYPVPSHEADIYRHRSFHGCITNPDQTQYDRVVRRDHRARPSSADSHFSKKVSPYVPYQKPESWANQSHRNTVRPTSSFGDNESNSEFANRLYQLSSARKSKINSNSFQPRVNNGNSTSYVHSRRVWCSIACFTATLMFLGAINTDFLPGSDTIALGSLLPMKHVNKSDNRAAVVLLIIMWGAHFLRRFAEILFVDIYRRDLHVFEVIGISVYYPVFGFWIGWSCNYFTNYWTPINYIFITGIFVFIVGECGNCACRVMSRQRADDTDTLTPSGCLFRYTSVPHYWFEVVTWIGFALSTFTLASCLFLACTVFIMLVKYYVRIRIIDQ